MVSETRNPRVPVMLVMVMVMVMPVILMIMMMIMMMMMMAMVMLMMMVSETRSPRMHITEQLFGVQTVAPGQGVEEVTVLRVRALDHTAVSQHHLSLHHGIIKESVPCWVININTHQTYTAKRKEQRADS
jgi:hypothetical protein